MNCPFCNNNLPDEFGGKFCPKCGGKIVRCATCGSVLTKKVKFCPKDGTPVPPEDYAALPDAESVAGAAAGAAIAGAAGAGAKAGGSYNGPQGGYNGPQRPYNGGNRNNNEKKSSKAPMIIIVVLAMIALGALGYIVAGKLLNKGNESSGTAAKQPVAEAPADTTANDMNNDTKEAEREYADEEDEKETEEAPEIEEEYESDPDEQPVKEKPEEPVKNKKVTAKTAVADSSLLSGSKKAKVIDAYSSSVVTDNDPNINNEASQMVDGNQSTSWQEGADGDGIGEWVQFELKNEYEIKYITFKLGNWRDQTRYNMNNRPKELHLELGGKEFDVKFNDGKKEYMVILSDPVPASYVYVEIRSVYKGTDWDDCCISEMGLYY